MKEIRGHSSFKLFEPLENLTGDGFLCIKWEDRIYPPFIDPGIVQKMMESWETQENDVFICTHQKVGTHLTKKFVVEIIKSAGKIPSDHPIASGDIGHGTIPWPEVMASQHGMDEFNNHINKTMGFPRVWYTHFSEDDMPFKYIHPKTKFIAVFRDPRGAAVSQYYFYRSHPLLRAPENLDMERFVDLFVKGNLYFGDYHRHVLGWIQGCRGRILPENLLVLRYEDLVENKENSVRQISQFLFPEKQLSDPQISEIAASTDFQTMKKEISENPQTFHFNPQTFFRSGKISDWQQQLSERSIQAIDEKTRNIWGGHSLSHPPGNEKYFKN